MFSNGQQKKSPNDFTFLACLFGFDGEVQDGVLSY